MENLFEKIDRLGLGKTSIGDVISEIDQLRTRNAELEAEVERLRKELVPHREAQKHGC